MTSAIWFAVLVAQATPSLPAPFPDDAFDHMRVIEAACFGQLDFDRASQLSSRLLEWHHGTADDYLAAALIESATRTPLSTRVKLLLQKARERGAPEMKIAYAAAEAARALLHAIADERSCESELSEDERDLHVRELRADWGAALRHVLELEPTNVWARWNLLLEDAHVFDDADEPNSAVARAADAESRKLLLELLKEDPERLGPFALPVFGRASREFEGGPRARPDVRQYREWRDSDLDVTLEPFTQGGPLGVDLPRPRMVAPKGVVDVPSARWTTAPQLRFATEGAVRSLDVADVERDFDDDVLVADARGLLLLRQARDGTFAPERLADVDATCARIADLERLESGDRSVVAGGPKGIAVFDPGPDGRWSVQAAETSRGACSDFLVLDFDGDGDEDVVAILGGALYAWRNEGFATTEDLRPAAVASDGRGTLWKNGPLRMAEAHVPFPKSDAPLTWIACEDFDGDRDVDLVCGGAGAATLLLRCRKLGRFETVLPNASGLRSHAAHRPLLADFDRDGVADVLWVDGPVAWQRGRGDGTFDVPEALPWLAPFASERATLADVDLDGELDLVAPDPSSKSGELVARLGSLLAESSATLDVGGAAPASSPAIVADLDLDAGPDVVAVAADGAGVELRAAQVDDTRHALHLRLWSGGSSARTFGAIVEARVDGRATRQFVSGENVVVASGGKFRPDAIEIDWTHARDGALPRQFLYSDYSSTGIEPCRRFRLDDLGEDSTVLVERPDRTLQFVSGFDFLRDPNVDRELGMREVMADGIRIRKRDTQPGDCGALAPRPLGGDWKRANKQPGPIRVVRQQSLPGWVPTGPHGPFRLPPR